MIQLLTEFTKNVGHLRSFFEFSFSPFWEENFFTIIFQEILCYYFQTWAIRITNQIKLLIWYHLEIKLHYIKLVCIYVILQRYHAMICKKCFVILELNRLHYSIQNEFSSHTFRAFNYIEFRLYSCLMLLVVVFLHSVLLKNLNIIEKSEVLKRYNWSCKQNCESLSRSC